MQRELWDRGRPRPPGWEHELLSDKMPLATRCGRGRPRSDKGFVLQTHPPRRGGTDFIGPIVVQTI